MDRVPGYWLAVPEPAQSFVFSRGEPAPVTFQCWFGNNLRNSKTKMRIQRGIITHYVVQDVRVSSPYLLLGIFPTPAQE